jgi:hypothetical protein
MTRNKDQKQIEAIWKEHKPSIESQIKKGASSWFVPKYFKWINTPEGVVIELLTSK